MWYFSGWYEVLGSKITFFRQKIQNKNLLHLWKFFYYICGKKIDYICGIFFVTFVEFFFITFVDSFYYICGICYICGQNFVTFVEFITFVEFVTFATSTTVLQLYKRRADKIRKKLIIWFGIISGASYSYENVFIAPKNI